MSKKGEAKKIKALNAPKSVDINRKENTWTIKTGAGPHKREDSIALGLLLRDQIKIVSNLKEAKNILNKKAVKVNGVVRKEYNFAVGLFDVIAIEEQELFYRVLFDKKRRIVLKELKENDNKKIVKVTSKIVTKKGIQIGTDDGRTILNDKAKVGDSLLITIPENKVDKVLELKEEALVYITKGAHCSSIGKIKEINKATARREKLVKVEVAGKDYETVSRNTVVIGDKKEEINL